MGGGDQLYGSIWILTGTILHSLTNVVNQKLLQNAAPDAVKIEPESLCHIIGAWSVLAWVVYIGVIVFYLGDSFSTLVVLHFRKKSGS